MNAVSNASPRITLARIDRLHLISALFATVFIRREVYNEVVIEGVSKPGATAVAQTPWIKVASISNPGSMPAVSKQFGFGAGETGAVILAHELGIQLVFRDESRGRRIAQQRGLAVVGCLGLLKELYRRRALSNLRSTYWKLLAQGIRIDGHTLNASLHRFGLPPL